ncbi:alpha/beta hydrolase [Aquidulcibacter paucihalophilus]|uniref:alpha/beta hydrolase n=1 Tax=Aquidulcibacter paucihalophilus TaxID=1978549 RepID=UPI000A193FC9|nr:alpha/beta hydrolase-fold protein [Aquidulcibacter paucihalophilus]
MAEPMFRTFENAELKADTFGLSHVTVKSKALGRRADVTVFIPEGLEAWADAPVVTLLHGVFSSHWAWAFKGEAHLTARALISQKLIPPMVLLMPSDGLWGDGSGYIKHADADYEKWILEEVPTIAYALTSACSSGSPRFLAGLSMGGFAALRLGAKFPNAYRAISAHSAVTNVAQLTQLIEEDTAGWSSNPSDQDIFAAMQSAHVKLPSIRFDCGTEDALLPANRELHHKMASHGLIHIFEELSGGHDWDYWKSNLHRTLLFFAKIGKGVAANAST